jgi:hypothetical protein
LAAAERKDPERSTAASVSSLSDFAECGSTLVRPELFSRAPACTNFEGRGTDAVGHREKRTVAVLDQQKSWQ